ncbi:MAG TPA: Fur family transcriptional regulator [Candidatus Tectomicrobia bacterium]|nr:Fur family transcriptional regulator [Candidatus Tectomicrobia bacterium]
MRKGTRNREIGMARTAEALQSKGFRLTPHREAVHAYLASVDHHPTAEEVYLAVKAEGSRLSLATVYNALEALVEAGLASKLAFGDGSARYDIRTDQHDHIHCLGCGMLRDLPPRLTRDSLGDVPEAGFQVTGYRLELLGYCAACRQRQTG